MNKSREHNGTGQKASAIYWGQVKYFSESEFHGELDKLDSGVVLVLDKLRAKVGRLMISPAPGAIARVAPGSMHDTTGGRLSVAIDVMPLDVSLYEFYLIAATIPEIGGIGLYPDWKPHPGAHIDLRARKFGDEMATWSGIKNADGKQVYGALSAAIG